MVDVDIDRKSSVPIHLQIVEAIRSSIVTHQLRPGDRLPATQELVAALGVSSHTIRQAMTQLEREGLINATPGRGTFVAPRPTARIAAPGHGRVKHLGIVIDLDDAPATYRADTIAGVLKECARQNVIPQIITERTIRDAIDDFWQQIGLLACDGLVWFVGDRTNWEILERAAQLQFPLVVVSRARIPHRFAGVESDFEDAGYRAGRHFIEQGCERMLMLSHFEFGSDDNGQPVQAPVGLRQGLVRAFGFAADRLDIELLDGYGPDVSTRALTLIQASDPRQGVLFTNGYQFGDVLRDHTTQTAAHLQGRSLVVVSNRFCSIGFLPQVLDSGLQFNVLADPFEQNARIAVQKLIGLIDGDMGNTTTLVKIDFEPFVAAHIVRDWAETAD